MNKKINQRKLKELYNLYKREGMFTISPLKKFKAFIERHPDMAKRYNLYK